MWELLNQLVGPIGLILGGLLLRRIRTPNDAERAQALALIARGAVALVLSKAGPNVPWVNLLAEVVRTMLGAAGLPTRNAGAIERAAAAELRAALPATSPAS